MITETAYIIGAALFFAPVLAGFCLPFIPPPKPRSARK